MAHHYLLMLNRGRETPIKYGIFEVKRSLHKKENIIFDEFVLLDISNSITELFDSYLLLKEKLVQDDKVNQFNFTTRVTDSVPCQFQYRGKSHHLEHIPDEPRKGLIKRIYVSEE